MIAAPIHAYLTFLSLKAHFSRVKFDYLTQRAKSNQAAYDKNRNKALFIKLAHVIPRDEIEDFMIANFAYTVGQIYVHDLLTPEADEKYEQFKKYRSAPAYYFTQDLDRLMGNDDFLSVFEMPRDSMYPYPVQEYLSHDIALETLVILNKTINLIDWYKIADDILWPTLKLKIQKFGSFVPIPKGAKEAITERFRKINSNIA